MTGLAIAEVALIAFAATLGFDRPATPIAGNAVWADLYMPIAALALAVEVAARRLRRDRPLEGARLDAPLLLAAAYVTWALASALASGRGLLKVVGLAELACVFACARAVTLDPAARRRVLRAFVLGALALAAIGLAGSLATVAGVRTLLTSPGGAFGWAGRPKGLAIGHDMLAALCTAAALLLLGDTPRALLGPRARTAAITLFIAILGLSLSRSVLAFAAGLAVLCLPRRAHRAAAIAALAIPIALSFRFELVRPTGLHLDAGPSLRLRIAEGALATIAAHPLLGAGPAGPVTFFGDWPAPGVAPRPWDAHLTWLDIPATLGLPALALFIAFLVAALRRPGPAAANSNGLGDYAEDPERFNHHPALVAAVAAILFDSLSLDVEDFRHLWLLVGLLAATALPPRARRGSVAA